MVAPGTPRGVVRTLEQAAKASLGKLQAKAILGGALGPGPAARTLPSGVGRQRLSGNVTLPTIGFT